MKKILMVFGTRPEAIKMAPLVKAFKKHKNSFHVSVCVTAQHREMLDQVLNLFEIIPDYDLDIMEPKQDLYTVTVGVLSEIKEVLSELKPDIVFVHGDTSTTFSAALAAYYQRIPVAHIEAGLRTGDIYSPWPEEANRKLISQITQYHFSPTLESMNNLLKENFSKVNICVTGNTVIDALYWVLNKIKSTPILEQKIITSLLNSIRGSHFDIHNSKFILITGHRRENHGNGMVNICNAIKFIAQRNKNIRLIYPVHLNPAVKEPVFELLSGVENIHLIKPLDYEQFVYLMDKAYFIITDSGGVQEEAPSLGKPVLVMRDVTERPEALEAGTVQLVGTDFEKIVKSANELIHNKNVYDKMSCASNPYGDGEACRKIIAYLKEVF